MNETPQIQARQIAHHVAIRDILQGEFVKEEGWNPSYVLVGQTKVSRINIIGTIISEKQENTTQTIVIDDGTDKITVRNFEKTYHVGVGDVVLLVGRIRQYGREIYVTPEIIKKDIDVKWASVWKKRAIRGSERVVITHVDAPEDSVQSEIEDVDEPQSDRDKILQKIRDLDDGNGAAFEEVVIDVSEDHIKRLLLEGEIFEIKPGRLKVLE